MVVRMDWHYWVKQYEDSYEKDTNGQFPKYLGENGKLQEDKSPYFDTLSKVVTDRGFLFKKEFLSIATWKTARQKRWYVKNSDATIQKISKKMIEAPDQDKLGIIKELKGVGIPVASAILTTVFPKDFCIIDYRAWRAILWLKVMAEKEECKFNSYEEYADFLDECNSYLESIKRYYAYRDTLRTIGKQVFTPRQIEMALWKFDQMKGK